MMKYLNAFRLRDLRHLVQRGAVTFGARTAYRELDPAGNVHDYSYAQVEADVAAAGTALFELGLDGQHVVVVGDSCYSYVVCYLAVANSGGVIVPLDKDLTNADLANLIDRSDAVAVLYSDSMHADMPEILAGCSHVRYSLNIGRFAKASHRPGFDALLDTGRALLALGDTRFNDVVIDVEKMSVILFTSGTTGPNKGVMLSHNNLTSVLHSAFSMHKVPDTCMSVLPINHSYEFNLNVLGCLYAGVTLCFNDSIMHVKDNLVRFQPGMSLMVPMIVEGLYKNIWKEAEKNRLAGHLRYGIWLSNLLRRVGIDLRRVYFRPVLENLGGLRLIVCGGAPLRPEIIEGITSLGIAVYNGYGITECSPLIATNSLLRSVPGSVGMPVPNIELRIGGKGADGVGEIQVRGENVMLGYYKDPEGTAAAFTEDGWFKTGDLGRIGRRGALFITGREKNLIILANGKNVQPEEIEEALMLNLEYLREVVVHESKDAVGAPAIAASAYLDPDWVNGMGSDCARARFEADVVKVNRSLAVYKRIHCTEVREHEFEKTSTKKIVRYRIEGSAP